MSKYVIALYIRLSIEDIKVESMSIDSQKALLHKYAEGLAEDTEIIEYVDNGHTGLNFERPAVQELLNDVQHHKINCIIVKDFSRFGRNSIEVGYFTQQVFPLYNVRFISVADCYDSNEHKGDTGGIEVSVKYLVNEFYSRDLSMKTRTAKYAKMRRGEYYSNNYPYGYLSDSNGKPIIDEAVKHIVKMIFELTIEGKSSQDIATILYKMNIPSPAQYRAQRGKPSYNISNCKNWARNSILNILKNEIYMGMYVVHKQVVQDVGSRKMVKLDEKDWIKIPNHFPAIVSEEVFQKANAVRRKVKITSMTSKSYPLRGKVYCGCCNHNLHYMKRIKPIYACRYTVYDENEPCYMFDITIEELQGILFDMAYNRSKEILEAFNKSNGNEAHNDSDQVSEIEKKIAEYQQKKQKLYEKFVSEEISLDEFKSLKEQYNDEIYHCEQQRIISMKISEKAQTANSSKTKVIQIAKDIQKASTLTKELSDTLIEKVYVYPDKSVKVVWKIKDFETQMPS